MVGIVAVAIGVILALTLSLRPQESSPETDSKLDSPQIPAEELTKKDLLTKFGGTFELLETVPHDPAAFTQGLMLHNGVLYEGTGLNGQSYIRIVDIKTGDILQQHALAAKYFGEGITYYDDPNVATGRNAGRLIQITWQEKTGFIYDSDTLQVLEEFTYDTHTGEGWGITYVPDRHQFLVSDGSEYLMTWDATTRQQIAKVPVMTRVSRREVVEQPVTRLNELEYDPFSDTVYSNIWYQDAIVRIDILTGTVLTVYDLRSLYTNRAPGSDVLNGIALTETPNELWVTGKLWPNMYRIRLIDPEGIN